MLKYPVFGIGVILLLLGMFSKYLFQFEAMWLVYLGVIVMFSGVLISYLMRRLHG